MPSTTFADLRLCEPILRTLLNQSYTTPTPIQAQAIPELLQGKDLLGIAQTGTGKTAAFALPILQALDEEKLKAIPHAPRALVLTPTRELASQVENSFVTYGKNLPLRHAVIFGGVGQGPQVQKLRRGVHTLVATPGRLLDLMQQGHVELNAVEIFVLDEADRILDMGFINDIRKILKELPSARQSLLFSATMPDNITKLAQSMLHNPVRVEVTPPATTVDRITQSVMLVEKSDKRALLAEVLKDNSIDKVLVFTRTKHGADRVVRHLRKLKIDADAIHGNKSQGARERALDNFRKGKARVLVATDVAARGIDVKDISHVINFDLPNEPENYVHRIGRTARAGKDGVALSFCDVDERAYLLAIERATRTKIPVETDHAFRSEIPFSKSQPAAAKPKGRSRGNSGRRSRPQHDGPPQASGAKSRRPRGGPPKGKPGGRMQTANAGRRG